MELCFVLKLFNIPYSQFLSVWSFDHPSLHYNLNGTLTYNKAVRGLNIQYKLSYTNIIRVTRDHNTLLCSVLFRLFVCFVFDGFCFLPFSICTSWWICFIGEVYAQSHSLNKLQLVLIIVRDVITTATITINDSYCPTMYRQHSWGSAH
jgi:hypothetical protein